MKDYDEILKEDLHMRKIEILKHAYLSDLEDQLDTDELFFAVQDKVLEDLTSLDDVITNTIEATSEMVINYASVIFEAVYNNVVNEIVTEADVLVPDKINNRPVEQYGTNLRSILETVVHHDNADSLVIHFMNEYEEELDTLLIPITTYDNAVTFINFWNNQKKTTPKLELENMRVISVVFGMYITVEVPEEHEWELQSLTKECRHSDELNKWL